MGNVRWLMMSEKRFRKLQGYMADNNRKYDNGNVYAMDFTEVENMLIRNSDWYE